MPLEPVLDPQTKQPHVINFRDERAAKGHGLPP
jgi:hypothetical protein